MIKIFLTFIAFLFIVLSVDAQRRKKTFSENSTQFKKELNKIIKQDKNEVVLSFYNLLDKQKDIKYIVQNFNILKTKKLSKNEYLLFIESLVKIDQLGELDDFVNKHYKEISNLLKSQLKLYLKVWNDFLYKQSLYEKKRSFIWSYVGKMNYTKDETHFKIEIFADSIICKNHRKKEMVLYDVKGYFIPSEKKIQIQNAKYYWNTKVKDKGLYVSFKNLHIDLTKKYFETVNARLHNFKNIEEIVGSFKMKLLSSKKTIYPLFNSNTKQIIEIDITKDIKYKGLLRLENQNVFGISENNQKYSSVIFYKRKEKIFEVKSNLFNLGKKSLDAPKSSFELFLGNKTISHINLSMSYNFENEVLNFIRNSNLSKTPIKTNYYRLNINFSSLMWNKKTNKVYLNGDKYNHVALFSINYYDSNMYSRFNNLEKNLLNKLYEMTQNNKDFKNKFDFKFISEYLNIPQVNIIKSLIDISIMGCLEVNLTSKVVTFTESFYNLIKHNDLKNDHDELILFSNNEKPYLSKIDLNNKITPLQMKNIDKIQFSYVQNVYGFPKDKLFIKKNNDLQFKGYLLTKSFIIKDSEKIEFNYKKYLIHIQNAKGFKFNKELAESKSSIENLEGILLIANPINKSGRKKDDKYPIFQVTKNSYIYYDDKKNYDIVYNRENFYAEIYPFKIDSLNVVKLNDIPLKGQMISADIFPKFPQIFNLQADNTVGFMKKKITKPLYKNKGKYTGMIILNGAGLQGKGKFSYLNAKIKSNEILFFPDSLKAKNTAFDLKASQCPISAKVTSTSSKIKWNVKQDILGMKSQDDFSMYDGSFKLKGELKLTPSKLSGKGIFYSKGIKFNSTEYDFAKKTLLSEKMNLSFYGYNDLLEVELPNISGNFTTIGNKKGDFTLNDTLHYVNLKKYNYKTNLKKIDWDFKKNKLIMKNIDDNLASFKSKKSPNFKAKKIIIDMKKSFFNAYDVHDLEIADVLITPYKRKLKIYDRVRLDTLTKAKISINKDFHIITDAKIKIFNKDKYFAQGKYNYVDKDSITHIVKFNHISVIQNKTIAETEIKEHEEFKVSPYFNFFGNLTLNGQNDFLKFDGKIKLSKIGCNFEIPSFTIKQTYINPKKVEFKFEKPLLNNVFYFMGKFNPAFLSTRKIDDQNKLIWSNGILNYNEEKKAYQIIDKRDGVLFSETLLYNDRCLLESNGKINLGMLQQTVTFHSFGKVKYNLLDKSIYINMDLGLNFFIDEKMATTMSTEINLSDTYLEDVEYKDESNYQMLVNQVLNKEERQKYNDEKKSGKITLDLPKKLKYLLSFRNIDFRWNKRQNAFISTNYKINCSMVAGVAVDRKFPGIIKIEKKQKQTIIEIYFKTSEKEYYYFRYKDNTVSLFTTNKKVSKIFNELTEEDRTKEINDKEYTYLKASFLKIKNIQKLYKKLYK